MIAALLAAATVIGQCGSSPQTPCKVGQDPPAGEVTFFSRCSSVPGDCKGGGPVRKARCCMCTTLPMVVFLQDPKTGELVRALPQQDRRCRPPTTNRRHRP